MIARFFYHKIAYKIVNKTAYQHKKSLHYEIERRFFIPKLPPIDGVRVKEIQQYYTQVKGDTETRVRLEDGERCYVVTKVGFGMVRKETQIEIPTASFEVWKPVSKSKVVKKTRYLIPYRKVTIELDVYGGWLRGLVTAEVQFPSEKAAMEFVPPAWFGKELTGVEEYSNRSLAMKGIPKSFSRLRR